MPEEAEAHRDHVQPPDFKDTEACKTYTKDMKLKLQQALKHYQAQVSVNAQTTDTEAMVGLLRRQAIAAQPFPQQLQEYDKLLEITEG